MLSSVYCVISHEATLERIHEVETGKSLIGRGEDSAIWLADPHVSREHAVLSWTGERASILDLASQNGIRINGRPMRGEASVCDGDEIKVGPYILRIFFQIGDAIRCFVNSDISTCLDLSPATNGEARSISSMKNPELTPAQGRVYDALIEGLSEKEVASRLKISVHTVHTHAKAIYRTFAISSRAELVRRWAVQQARRGRRS
jgi:DNA-binding CsgD family transcriptional regulator